MVGDFIYLPTATYSVNSLTKLTSSRGNEEGCVGEDVANCKVN